MLTIPDHESKRQALARRGKGNEQATKIQKHDYSDITLSGPNSSTDLNPVPSLTHKDMHKGTYIHANTAQHTPAHPRPNILHVYSSQDHHYLAAHSSRSPTMSNLACTEGRNSRVIKPTVRMMKRSTVTCSSNE